LMVVDFCLFSKLTLVASMEYPVLTVLLFAILRFLTFVYSYTRIKCQWKFFFFSRSVFGMILLFVIPVLKLIFSEYDTISVFRFLCRESRV
jgi:hypothetical protein